MPYRYPLEVVREIDRSVCEALDLPSLPPSPFVHDERSPWGPSERPRIWGIVPEPIALPEHPAAPESPVQDRPAPPLEHLAVQDRPAPPGCSSHRGSRRVGALRRRARQARYHAPFFGGILVVTIAAVAYLAWALPQF